MADPEKAFLEPERGSRIPCLFNPAELKITKSNEWKPSRAKGKNTPALRFQSGKSGTLSMTLMLDTTEEGRPVTEETTKLLDLMKVDPGLSSSDSRRNRARPPWVRFHWGDFHSFKAIVEKLDLTFVYFSSQGAPLRAKAVVALKQYADEDAFARQNPTSGTPAPHQVHQLQPGETLDRVAASHYGDPSQWRVIAEANDVLDPFAVTPGQVLAIPELRGVSRGR